MDATTTRKPAVDVHLRWMIRRDMPEVLAIEKQCFEFPWDDEDFIKCLCQRNCIGMVAESCERIAGFMIYEIHRGHIYLISLAVSPERWLGGVGRQMVNKLKGKLSSESDRRSRIVSDVRETNLDAQLFFRECGFKAVAVLRNFESTGEDAFRFQFVHGQG